MMVERFRILCAQDPRITSAYYFLAAAPGYESYPQPILGLSLSSSDDLSEELIAEFQDSQGPKAHFSASYPNLYVYVLGNERAEPGLGERGF
jgi:hypothetical protein